MSDVIDLASRRAESVGFSTCLACGGAYFTVDYVTLGKDGHVEGRAGTPVCINCGVAADHLGPPPMPDKPTDLKPAT